MKKINETKFLEDYEAAVKEREIKLADKEAALAAEKAKVDSLVGYSDHVKEVVYAEVSAEVEKEFDIAAEDEKIAGFEKYLEEVEEVVEEDGSGTDNVELDIAAEPEWNAADTFTTSII